MNLSTTVIVGLLAILLGVALLLYVMEPGLWRMLGCFIWGSIVGNFFTRRYMNRNGDRL